MENNSNFGLSKIAQIAIHVVQPARAAAFYKDILGMQHLFTVGDLAFFDCGGVRLMLSPAEKPEFDHPASVLYYKVDDILEAYETLRGQGVNFEGVPHIVAKMPSYDLWMAFFQDSEGNTLAIMSEEMLEAA